MENDKLNLQFLLKEEKEEKEKIKEENHYLKKKNEVMNLNIVDQEELNGKIKKLNLQLEEK